MKRKSKIHVTIKTSSSANKKTPSLHVQPVTRRTSRQVVLTERSATAPRVQRARRQQRSVAKNNVEPTATMKQISARKSLKSDNGSIVILLDAVQPSTVSANPFANLNNSMENTPTWADSPQRQVCVFVLFPVVLYQ
jgi:hypothetical protein